MAKGISHDSESLRKDLFKANKKIESLKKELNRLARITELVKDLVIITDEEGVINYTSNSLEKILGFTSDDLYGKKLSGLVHPDDLIAYEVFVRKIILNSSSSILQRIKTKSNKYIWLETTCSKKKIQSTQFYFNLRDLSERMQLQRDLVVSHQRYKSLVENLPFVIFRYDQDFRIIFVSPNVSGLLPFESEEIIGSQFDELGFDEKRVAFFKKYIKKVFDSRKTIEKEFEQETQKGLLILNWKLIPEFDENNRVITVLGIMDNVTNLRKIQRELESSEEKFRQIFNTIPDAVALSRLADGKLLDVNQGFLNLTGYRYEEVINRTSIEIKLFKDKNSRDAFLKKLENGPVINEELVFYTRDLISIDVLISASPVQIHSEDLLISIFRDVTEIKESERKLSATVTQLQQTDEKFNAFLEHSPDGITLTNSDGDIVDWNKSMEKFTGLSRKQVIGKSWFEVQERLDEINIGQKIKKEFLQTKVKDLIGGITANSFQKKFEISLLPKRGSIIHLENILFNILGDKGSRLGLISRDITQEKINRENALLYKQIFNNNEDGIAILNSDGAYREINNAYKNISGYTHSDLHENTAGCLIGKKTWSEVFKVYQFQGIFEGELKAKTKSGKEIFLDFLMFPVILDNVTLCIVQIIRDISNRKRAEADLVNAKRRAEEADRLKTAFLSNMSHEIRTPMNSILGFASLLENPGISEDQRRKYIQYISKNGENLLNLIGDIIDIAKIESNQLKISKSSCKVHDLLDELKESMMKIIELEEKSGLELRSSFDREKKLMLFTDAFRLRQILINLIYNAIKFTSKGFVEFGYTISSEKEVLFYVKDSGIGIPDEMQEKIFERFHKLESSKMKLYGGAGLGLAISSQLIKLLGGRIWLESYVDKGSTFYFTIPYILTEENESGEPAITDTEPAINWNKKKFLIVEDDQYSADLILEYFNNTGATLLFSESGKMAVNQYAENPDIDLIIMDIRMPEMTGIEAARLLHQINPAVPIIAQTAFALDEDRETLNSAGFRDILIKPVSRKHFLKIIDFFLKN